MNNNYELEEFNVYRAAVRAAAKRELPHDRIENGMVVYHIPDNTSSAVGFTNDVKTYVHRFGWKVNITWLDGWTVKITWHK